MSFGIYMFCRHKYENSPKCAIKKAYSSKTYPKAQPNSNFGLEHQRGSNPGLASNPPEQGSGDRAGPVPSSA
jgi:hypothetical protein